MCEALRKVLRAQEALRNTFQPDIRDSGFVEERSTHSQSSLLKNLFWLFLVGWWWQAEAGGANQGHSFYP